MTSQFFISTSLMNFLIIWCRKKLRSVLENEGTSSSVDDDDSNSANLSFEEENAVQYIGGFVKKLQENPDLKDFRLR